MLIMIITEIFVPFDNNKRDSIDEKLISTWICGLFDVKERLVPMTTAIVSQVHYRA